MAYQALYRKWRPTTFEQVIGQTATVRTLRSQIAAGRIAHAYLFCGCRGTGKTTIAKLMSRAINCESPLNGDPCGECATCHAIMNETTMDVLEIDAASNNGVDNIRDLLEQVRYPAQLGKYKVYIIDEVHMLSTAAFNALLKTLEEPPPYVVFILATTEPQKLPATILSRVQRYEFGRIPSILMVERMRLALTEMQLGAEDEALGMVANAAEGAMRDAFSILDMCIASAQNGLITAAQVRDVLGTSDREFLFAFAQLLAARDTGSVMHKVDELMRSGREPQVFLRELSSHCRALLTVKAVTVDAASILDVTAEDEQRYRKQAEAFTQPRLLCIMDLLMHAEGELRFASTPRIGLEAAVLHACEEWTGEDGAALLERIGELEEKLKKLEKDITNGNFVMAVGGDHVQQGSTKTKDRATPQTPRKAVAPPIASDAKGVWEAALKALAKTEPPLFGLLNNGRFIGIKDNVYQVLIPFSQKDFNYIKLGEAPRKELVAQALSAAAGTTVLFEVVLDLDPNEKKQDNVRQEAQKSLIDTFGREDVQIDEEKQ